MSETDITTIWRGISVIFKDAKGVSVLLVSTKGRYALRVLVDLARHQGEGRVPLKEVAERQGISEKYLENILAVLVRSDMLFGSPKMPPRPPVSMTRTAIVARPALTSEAGTV